MDPINLTLRLDKGSPLTHEEEDNNFSALKAAIEQVGAEAGGIAIYNEMPVDPPLYRLFMVVDVEAPVVTDFEVEVDDIGISIRVFEATDNIGVYAWWIGETPDEPLLTDAAWSASKPTRFSPAAMGDTTLYARARDAAGNISEALVLDVVAPSYVNVHWPYSSGVYSATIGARAGGDSGILGGVRFNQPINANVAALDMVFCKDASYPGTGGLVVELRSGGYAGTVLASHQFAPFSDTAFVVKRVPFVAPVALTAGTDYYITARCVEAVGDTVYRLPLNEASGQYGYNTTGSWLTGTGHTPIRQVLA